MITKYPKTESVNPSTCYSNKMMMCNRIIGNIFRKHLQQFDITDTQLSILFFTSKCKDVTQKTISDFLVSEKSTVNRNIKRMIDKELLEAENYKIALTEKGKILLENIIPSWEIAMNEVKEIIGEDGENAINTIHLKLKNQ